MGAVRAAAPARLPTAGPGALLRRRPTAGAELLAAVCWLVSLWWMARGAHAGGADGMPQRAGPALADGLPRWGAMAGAMMLPGALPAVRHVADHSLRWRRGRAQAAFVATYLAIWLAFGAALLTLLAWAHLRGGVALTLALAVAAAWQLTPRKRRALWDCHRSSPLPPRGWPATRGVVRFARRNAVACVSSCWPLMAVMTVATGAQLIWMVALTGLSAAEKLVQRPRSLTRHGAAWLAIAAGVAAVASLSG
jgi:predicted metal-binding membrane protein